MEREDLPEYKRTFLQEMEELRQQQNQPEPQMYGQQPKPPALIQNNILNTSQYSQPHWKQHLNQSFYKRQHAGNQFDLNLLMNPEVKKKQHNINITPISEYSNARHNNTVFVNPKHTSC